MRVLSPDLIKGKKVILRLDLDVPIKDSLVEDDYRLKTAIPTIKLCLENATQTIAIGHIGRPQGQVVPQLSVQPVRKWFKNHNLDLNIEENLRFNPGEDNCDIEFARQLVKLGSFFVNEAFAAHHPTASTTVLPTLLPSVVGLRFAKEVEVLTKIRENPKKPFVAIIGGVKIEDKLPAVLALSSIADAVLVGGRLAQNIKDQKIDTPMNVMVGKLAPSGIDMAEETINSFTSLIKNAKQIVWSGPLGKYEDPQGNLGNKRLTESVISSGAESIIGGGDTISALNDYLDKFSFVSVGGGAMLEFLTIGTLPTIEVLNG